MSPPVTAPLDLLTDPTAIRKALTRLRALQTLQLVITDYSSEPVRAPLRLARGNAILSATITLLDPETILWRDAIQSAGGTVSASSIRLADALIRAIKATTFSDKLIYLLPLLGGDLTAARMPLRDALGVGMAASYGFAEADFAQATGLTSDGATKRLDLLIKPSQVGASDNGGIGYWEGLTGHGTIGTSGSGFESLGSSGASFSVQTRAADEIFSWSGSGTRPFTGVASGLLHYYGQRISNTDRRLYRSGVEIASNTAVGSVNDIAGNNFNLMGSDQSGTLRYYYGRCKVAYLTDGTLTTSEIAELHTLLTDYLITPTGR